MTRAEFLGLYATGWTEGDPNKLRDAAADGYVLRDPHVGNVRKRHLDEYVRGLNALAASVGVNEPGLLTITDVLTQDGETELVAWARWSIAGSKIQGAGLIRVGDQGVISEDIFYD